MISYTVTEPFYPSPLLSQILTYFSFGDTLICVIASENSDAKNWLRSLIDCYLVRKTNDLLRFCAQLHYAQQHISVTSHFV